MKVRGRKQRDRQAEADGLVVALAGRDDMPAEGRSRRDVLEAFQDLTGPGVVRRVVDVEEELELPLVTRLASCGRGSRTSGLEDVVW